MDNQPQMSEQNSSALQEYRGHTPGPWESDDENQIVANNCIVAVIANWKPEGDANARLIAAAPDLLVRLQTALDYIKELDGGDQRSETGWKSDELLDVWMKGRIAIAKATGGQP